MAGYFHVPRMSQRDAVDASRERNCHGRFTGTRGFGGLPVLEGVAGKRIVKVTETGQTISAPSSLIKVFFEENDVNDRLSYGQRLALPDGRSGGKGIIQSPGG